MYYPTVFIGFDTLQGTDCVGHLRGIARSWSSLCDTRKWHRSSSSFQMTVESHFAVAISTFSDWLKNLAPVFQPEPIAPCTRDFSRSLCKFQVISRNSNWFIALFSTAVIGRGIYFGTGDGQHNLVPRVSLFPFPWSERRKKGIGRKEKKKALGMRLQTVNGS